MSFPKQRLRQTIKDGLPYSRIVKETGLASMLKITGREEGTACLEVTAVPSSPYPDYSTGI